MADPATPTKSPWERNVHLSTLGSPRRATAASTGRPSRPQGAASRIMNKIMTFKAMVEQCILQFNASQQQLESPETTRVVPEQIE